MDTIDVMKTTEYLQMNNEKMLDLRDHLHEDKITESDLFDMRIAIDMNNSYLLQLEMALVRPETKKTKKFWKK